MSGGPASEGWRGELSRSRACVDKRLLEDRETRLGVLVADRERREEPEDVPVDAAGQEEQAALERRLHGRGGERRRLLGELEGEHRAEAANLADLGYATRDAVEAGAEEPPELLGAPPELRLGNRVEDGRRGGAGDRVAAEGAAEAARGDGVHELGPAGDSGERKAAADRLPGDEKVRLGVVVLDRPYRTGAADAALHLVVDVEDPVAVAEPAQALREVGRHGDEAALALHGLEDDARDALGVDLGLEEALERVDRVVRRDAAVRVRRRR